MAAPLVCKFCGHVYWEPCDAEKEKTCPNIKLRDKTPPKPAETQQAQEPTQEPPQAPPAPSTAQETRKGAEAASGAPVKGKRTPKIVPPPS